MEGERDRLFSNAKSHRAREPNVEGGRGDRQASGKLVASPTAESAVVELALLPDALTPNVGRPSVQRKVAELQRDLQKQIRMTKESTARLSTQLDKIRKGSRGGPRLSGISEEGSDSDSDFGGSVGAWSR